ncbi:M-phase inducer phosphatase-like [Sitophilus oryzae]|uniref:protein-tyrosine-phosphatase n=1 Tax=Sitophilus oryzae TaxID=7048 RepID=A0A6J2XDI2_SITOR|nr:M-phase inducer phosphatase-like [Sitophilus oryzae]
MDIDEQCEVKATHNLSNGVEYVSLYDTNSRDSGFEDVPMENLGDEEFLEEFSDITFTESDSLPADFSDLIQRPLAASGSSVEDSEDTDSPLKKRLCQRTNDESKFTIRKKKLWLRKSSNDDDLVRKTQEFGVCSSEETIRSAIQKMSSEMDYIGDFSRGFSLPLSDSRHQDLKAINCITMRKLMTGEYDDKISSFKIIDCRYPYEYDGGHISGAVNIYTHEQCDKLFEEQRCSDKANILVFHCEFSAERGPNLYRYLRREDRRRNANIYPYLCYPEVYILEGGYRKFFNDNSSLCCPENYVQMLDSRFSEDLRYFRQKCKTLDSDTFSLRKKTLKSMLNVKKLTF